MNNGQGNNNRGGRNSSAENGVKSRKSNNGSGNGRRNKKNSSGSSISSSIFGSRKPAKNKNSLNKYGGNNANKKHNIQAAPSMGSDDDSVCTTASSLQSSKPNPAKELVQNYGISWKQAKELVNKSKRQIGHRTTVENLYKHAAQQLERQMDLNIPFNPHQNPFTLTITRTEPSQECAQNCIIL